MVKYVYIARGTSEMEKNNVNNNNFSTFSGQNTQSKAVEYETM